MAQKTDTSCVTCPLCNKRKGKLISSKDRHREPLKTYCCGSCGMVFNHPLPTKTENEAFYSHQYRRQYKKTTIPKKRHHYRYARQVIGQVLHYPAAYKKASKILDIGAGSGEFCALMSAMKKNVQAVEPTKSYAEYIRQTFGVSVFAGQIDDFKTTEKFDFVRLNHVLEHMIQPIQQLVRIREMMHDNAILHIEVPDFKEYCRLKSPGRIFHYGHIYNFDNYTLRATAAKAGFAAVYTVSNTSIYFKKCPPFELEHDENNAQDNFDAFNRNFQGLNTSVQNRFAKLVRRIISILQEQFFVVTSGNPQSIIENQAKHLRKLLDI